mmetsp:Transcript_14797/g.34699  ORF Transcript_14797/g.34699 Transcript_14797/m.34699 type:complete len:261 (+) Transcript_14797:823-1605(+)
MDLEVAHLHLGPPLRQRSEHALAVSERDRGRRSELAVQLLRAKGPGIDGHEFQRRILRARLQICDDILLGWLSALDREELIEEEEGEELLDVVALGPAAHDLKDAVDAAVDLRCALQHHQPEQHHQLQGVVQEQLRQEHRREALHERKQEEDDPEAQPLTVVVAAWRLDCSHRSHGRDHEDQHVAQPLADEREPLGLVDAEVGVRSLVAALLCVGNRSEHGASLARHQRGHLAPLGVALLQLALGPWDRADHATRERRGT